LPFGPVFRWEIAAIARRERAYLIRWIYGLVILVCFSFPLWRATGLSSARELDHRELAAASQESFGMLLAGQALAIFVVTPALFAGAIAQEVERGNYVFLIASPLSSVELILDKLGPRMAQLILLLAVAVPVLGLLSLNGGVDFELVVLSDGILLTSAFLIASAAMMISVVTGGLHPAVLWTYLVEALWLGAPLLLSGVAAFAPPLVSEWAGSIASLVALTSPFSVLEELATLPATIVGDFLTVMLVQLGLGVLLVITAAALLRPVAQGAGPFGWRLAPVSFLLSRRRLLPRPHCGERPVLWKEMHVARSRVLTRVVLTLVLLAAFFPLGWATWNTAVPAFQELASAGYGSTIPSAMREDLNLFLRFTLVMIYLLSAVGLAVISATCVTSEKARDTWTSLIASPLTAREIVSQKLIGSCWRLRWAGLVYLLFLSLGVAAGAIHPVGAILSVVQITIFLGFVAGLGTYFSLVCKSSVHALGWTFFLLFAINGGYLLGCFLLDPIAVAFFLVTPLAHAMSLATYPEIDEFVRGSPHLDFGHASEVAWLIILNGAFYAVAAGVLCYKCIQALETAAGRPRHGRMIK